MPRLFLLNAVQVRVVETALRYAVNLEVSPEDVKFLAENLDSVSSAWLQMSTMRDRYEASGAYRDALA